LKQVGSRDRGAVQLLSVPDLSPSPCSFLRLCLEWRLLAAFRCGPEGLCVGIWPRSTPCTGQQTPSEKDAAGCPAAHRHREQEGSGRERPTNTILFLSHRLLVSASQDGKLIVWDTYTTNKVRVTWLQKTGMGCRIGTLQMPLPRSPIYSAARG